MHLLSLSKLSQALQTREFSSSELTQHYLSRIQNAKQLNAFISVDEKQALSQAAQADKLLQQGQTHPLTGIPMAHKDIFCTRHLPTTCGSKMLAQFVAPYEATLVKRLHQVGAVMLGKTNMDEFAMGSSNENSFFGAVKNPWDTSRVPGGSSGGSAAAIAARLVPYATGSDTGGSVRQPAAFCGLSGLKPTYGLISRFGMVAYASSLDQAGPMAPSVEDLAIILQTIAGFDELDSTSINEPVPDYVAALTNPIKSWRIGLPRCFFQPEVAEPIQQAIRKAVALFESAGATIVELDLQLESLWVPCYYVIACAEASSNLERYDGVRYGYRTQQANTLHELITKTRSEGFGIEVKRRLLTGTHLLSSGYFDDYYVQAQKVRRLIQNELVSVLKQVDVILGPTTPTCAFKLGEKPVDPTQRYLADIFTVTANLAGLPALSIPAGFDNGLPIGMQLLAAPRRETTLLTLAHHYQQQTNWHQAIPTLPEDRGNS